MTSAEPDPELTEPEPDELLLPEVVLDELSELVVAVVPEACSEAWERAAAPIAIVAATAATARPAVTTTVLRWADSRGLIAFLLIG